MGECEESYPVKLYVYDLSQGLARQLSTSLLGTAIEGVWHTSVVVYGLEYYYSGGIVNSDPSHTPYGKPIKVVDLGRTQVPREVFEEFLNEISPRYTAQTYSLLKNNCNNFSNEVSQFLVGTEIPEYILRLPQDVMAAPMGALLLPMIEQMETSLRYGAVPNVPQAAASLPQSMQAPVVSAVSKNNRAESSAVKAQEVQEVARKKPVEDANKSGNQGKIDDAKAKVHEEISREFAMLMASGGLRASEAAALAARRVMQRHGIGASMTSSQS